MKFESKYYFGDVVYHIWQKATQTWETCPFCGGEKKTTGKDGSEHLCPKCYGRAGQYILGKQEWQVVETLTIAEIRIKARAEDPVGIDPGTIFANYGPQKGLYEEEYMCKETGVGSGSVYDVSTLFPSKDEAQAQCDRRNRVKK